MFVVFILNRLFIHNYELQYLFFVRVQVKIFNQIGLFFCRLQKHQIYKHRVDYMNVFNTHTILAESRDKRKLIKLNLSDVFSV